MSPNVPPTAPATTAVDWILLDCISDAVTALVVSVSWGVAVFKIAGYQNIVNVL